MRKWLILKQCVGMAVGRWSSGTKIKFGKFGWRWKKLGGRGAINLLSASKVESGEKDILGCRLCITATF